MQDINYYRIVQNAFGCNSESEVQRNSAIRELERSFEKTIDVESFVIWQHNEITESEIRFEVTKEEYSSANGFTIKGMCLINNPVVIGDVLFSKERNQYFICTQSYKPSRTHYKCVLTRCNNFLKWQDEHGNIYEYPIFDMNSTQYNSGVSGDKITILGSSQHMITITADENTIALNHDKRFFIDRNINEPTVFKLTQNDTTAYQYDKGILKITVSEEQYNSETDDIKEWLCDYIEPKIESDFEISYNGEPTVRVGGQKTFYVKSGDEMKWEVSSDNFDINKLNIVPAENRVLIKCVYDESLFDGKSFILTGADIYGNKAEITIRLVGGV